MKQKKLNVLYVRLSEEDTKKTKNFSNSIYNQLSLIREYAKKRGITIDKEYIDDGYSGINFDRPNFEKLKEDIENGEIGIVITKDISRLGREYIETAYYISEYFPEHNVRYIAINDSYDSNDPDNPFKDIIVSIRAIMNDRHVKETSVKRKQIAYYKTEQGEYIGTYAPYGYKIVKENKRRTLEIDNYSASIVKRIFCDIVNGQTREQIAQKLNDEKVPPPIIYSNMKKGKNKDYYDEWTNKIIYRILKNETYIGNLIVRKSIKKNYRDKKREYVAIRDRETIKNTHPAIVSKELFEEANAKLKTSRRREKNDYDGTFSGLVICGECGRAMSVHRRKRENGNIQYYFACNKITKRMKCKNRIIHDSKLKNIIKDVLKDLINTFVNNDDVIDIVSKESIQKDRLNLKISNLEMDIKYHENNIKDLYIKKTKNEISLEDFLKFKSQETITKEAKEQTLKTLIEKNRSDSKKQEIMKLYNNFINGDIMLKDYIKDIIEEIVIYKDNTIKITFKFGVGKTKEIKLY